MQLTIDDVRSRLAELKTFVAHAGKQCEDTLEVVQTDEDISKHNDGGTMESHVHISGDSENNPKQSAQTDSRHHGCRNGRGYYRPQAEGAPFRSPDNSKDDDGFTREFVQKARGHSKKKDHVSKQFTQKDEDHGTMGNWRGCDGHSSNVPSWRRRHLGASARSDHSQDDGRVTTEPVNKDKDFSKDDDGNPMHFGQIDKVQSEGDGCVLQPDTGLFKDKGLSTLPKAQRKEVMGHTKTQIRLKKNPATPMVEVSSELSETKNVSQGTSTSIASRETLENRQIPELHSKQPSPNQQPSVTADINVSAKRVESYPVVEEVTQLSVPRSVVTKRPPNYPPLPPKPRNRPERTQTSPSLVTISSKVQSIVWRLNTAPELTPPQTFQPTQRIPLSIKCFPGTQSVDLNVTAADNAATAPRRPIDPNFPSSSQ